MKNLISSILVLCSISCFAQIPSEIYEIELGDSKEKVIEILNEKGHAVEWESPDIAVADDAVYMDISWDNVALQFYKESLISLSFVKKSYNGRKLAGQAIDLDEQIKSTLSKYIIKHVDTEAKHGVDFVYMYGDNNVGVVLNGEVRDNSDVSSIHLTYFLMKKMEEFQNKK